MWNYVFDISHIIDTVGVIEKVKDLLKGHPSLFLCLNPFLPNGYEIILNDEDEKTYFMEQALSFLKISKIQMTVNLSIRQTLRDDSPFGFSHRDP
ncbi:hypothetical protein MTR67_018657 [Solanum verrucosum]|uniref:Uncharacterized protein n=1 Tax=Solanum verrucosum TaxID=315347 RepID=A0AAF0QK29_SOLVR|nr:hypothetical protein MTR67_018657 [Solanum verrucosum]